MTVLHRFLYSDGADPRGRLLKASDGLLYGTATNGGQFQGGVVYRIDPAQAISVASVSPASGPAAGGTSVTIAGSTSSRSGRDDRLHPGGGRRRLGRQPITTTAPALAAGAAYDVVVENPDLSRASRARPGSWTPRTCPPRISSTTRSVSSSPEASRSDAAPVSIASAPPCRGSRWRS